MIFLIMCEGDYGRVKTKKSFFETGIKTICKQKKNIYSTEEKNHEGQIDEINLKKDDDCKI